MVKKIIAKTAFPKLSNSRMLFRIPFAEIHACSKTGRNSAQTFAKMPKTRFAKTPQKNLQNSIETPAEISAETFRKSKKSGPKFYTKNIICFPHDNFPQYRKILKYYHH